MKIRCIVIDDKPLAVDLLTDYIKKISFLDLKAATTDAIEGLELIKNGNIDLVFLDILMPQLNGLKLVKLTEKKTQIILTTAYTDYAMDGYELDVVDYLLKSIDFDRFYQAAEKAFRRQGQGNVPNESKDIRSTNDFLFVKSEHSIRKIDLADVILIEGLENYVSIVTSQGRILSLQTMKRMEEQLPLKYFVRVHRSFIVSLKQISHIQKNTIILSNGVSVPIGSSYRSTFFNSLEGN